MSAKLHHYLPQAYLANFCNQEGRLWVRDCKKKENRRQTPKGVAAITHYYSIELEEGRDNSIEEYLSKIETLGMPIILELNERKNISLDQKYSLSLFLGYLWNRVPDFQSSVDKIYSHAIKQQLKMMHPDEQATKKSLEEFEKETGTSFTPEQKDEIAKHIAKEGFDVNINRIASLEMMMKLSEDIANIFVQMDWIIAHCSNLTSFITTDNPLVLMPPPDYPENVWYGYGIATPNCRKIVPLTQTCCLIMTDKGDKIAHGDFTDNNTININKFVSSQVHQYLIARDESLLNSFSMMADYAAQNRDGRITIG